MFLILLSHCKTTQSQPNSSKIKKKKKKKGRAIHIAYKLVNTALLRKTILKQAALIK